MLLQSYGSMHPSGIMNPHQQAFCEGVKKTLMSQQILVWPVETCFNSLFQKFIFCQLFGDLA